MILVVLAYLREASRRLEIKRDAALTVLLILAMVSPFMYGSAASGEAEKPADNISNKGTNNINLNKGVKVIRGFVRDEHGRAIPGADVVVPGAGAATRTSGKGEFELRITNTEKLRLEVFKSKFLPFFHQKYHMDSKHHVADAANYTPSVAG